MKNKNYILIVIILIIAIASAIIAAILYTSESKCENPEYLGKIDFVSCYNTTSKNLEISWQRSITELNLTLLNKKYKIDTSKNSAQIPLDENPSQVILDIYISSNQINYCPLEKTILIQNCTDFSVVIEPGQTANTTNKSGNTSDIIPVNLTNRTFLFNSSCVSNWVCSPWEQCVSGIQRRNCIDKNKCQIESNFPDFTKNCTSCNENWRCSWSQCTSGLSTPTCTDLNNCGTNFSIPSEIACINSQCTPDIACSDWSACKVDYTFQDLTNVQNLNGIKTRLCQDKNNCAYPSYESQDCSMRVDIISKHVTICNQEYIEIYDKLSGVLLARINNQTLAENPSLNINLYESPENISC